MRSPLLLHRHLLTLAATCIAAAGCDGEKSAAPAAGKTFTIAMIAKSSTNPVFLSGRQGAEAAAAELSKARGSP